MKKVGIAFMLVCVLLIGLAGSALAASYSFTFIPPLIESRERSLLTEASGEGAYVAPSSSAQMTTCYIALDDGTIATNLVNVYAARRSFKYRAGCADTVNGYRLCANPRYADFTEYEASGTWQP